MNRSARWMPIAVTTAVAVGLACVAIVTADQAACQDPGRYVQAPGGLQLIGGCLREDDLPVAPPGPLPQRPAEPVGH